MTKDSNRREIWFLTGSQGLYGPEVVEQVIAQSREICDQLSGAKDIPYDVVWKPVLLDSASIHRQILDANAALVFSPDPPAYYGMITFPEGGRFMADFTDSDKEQVKVGAKMRMTFRIRDNDTMRGGFKRYFWKAAPV